MKDTYKKNEMNNTIFSNGIKEILQFLIDKEVKSFTQIKKIKNRMIFFKSMEQIIAKPVVAVNL